MSSRSFERISPGAAGGDWSGIEEMLVSGNGGVTVVPRTRDREVIELLGALLERSTARTNPPETVPLLDRKQVAKWLGVSERTITRRLRPTSQPARGGKSWYDPEDVERQLRELGPLSAHKTATRRQRPRRAATKPAPSNAKADARVDVIEARLRGGLTRERKK